MENWSIEYCGVTVVPQNANERNSEVSILHALRSRKLRRSFFQKCHNPFSEIITLPKLAHIVAFQIELLVQQ